MYIIIYTEQPINTCEWMETKMILAMGYIYHQFSGIVLRKHWQQNADFFFLLKCLEAVSPPM